MPLPGVGPGAEDDGPAAMAAAIADSCGLLTSVGEREGEGPENLAFALAFVTSMSLLSTEDFIAFVITLNSPIGSIALDRIPIPASTFGSSTKLMISPNKLPKFALLLSLHALAIALEVDSDTLL
jgi:hypothetical protein